MADPEVALPVEKQWLEDLLNKEFNTNASIEHVACTTIAEGKGFLSIITKADLTWSSGSEAEENQLPRTVIFKVPTLDKITQLPFLSDIVNVDVLTAVHNTEVSAYQYLNAHPPPPIPTARCFHAEKMTELGTGMLILEGINGRSHTFSEDNTLEQTKSLLDNVAKLQAYAHRHPEYKDIFGKLPFADFDMILAGVKPAAEKLREKYAEFTLTDDEIDKSVDKFVKECKPMILDGSSSKYATTFCLGDLQPNNILWAERKDGSLADHVAALIDFQAANRGVYVADVGNIINHGLSLSNLKSKRESVMEYYYDRLTSLFDGRPPISLDELKETYKVATLGFTCLFLSFLQQSEVIVDVMGISEERVKELVAKTVYLHRSCDI